MDESGCDLSRNLWGGTKSLLRAWPGLRASPVKTVLPMTVQVFYTMQKMDEYGCDLFLDIHGDEEIPFNFLAGSEGIPSFNERLRELQNTFSQAFVRASPDFQPKNGYTVDEPGKANLAISSNGVIARCNVHIMFPA